jgi:hypothetical protein
MLAHPAASLFPALDEESFQALKRDIKTNGQISPIIVVGAQILDGCNRNRACTELGIAPIAEEWDGRCGSPLAFVISKNLKRRHLATYQRAMIAARLSNLEKGQAAAHAQKKADVANEPFAALSMEKAAELLNVSRVSVVRARLVIRMCSAEDVNDVEIGKVSLQRAYNAIKAKRVPSTKSKNALATVGRNPERIERTRLRNAVWRNVRTALIALTSLPLPADAARLAKEMDRQKLIHNKLPGALAWLKEFANVCNGKTADAAAEQQRRDESRDRAEAAE